MTPQARFHQAAQAYRGNVAPVSSLAAIVALLDTAILALRRTIDATENKRFEEGHNHMIRATTILRGLIHQLDYDKGGKLAERLANTYNLLILACLRSFGQKNASEHYRRLIGALTELRDAWKWVEESNVRAKVKA